MRLASHTTRVTTRFYVRRRCPLTDRREDFALNRARNLVRVSHTHLTRHAQVHVDEVQSPLMPMPHRGVRTDRRRLSRAMSIENREDLLMILRILCAENRREPAKRDTRTNDDKQHADANRNCGVNPPLPRDPDRDETGKYRERRPKVGEQVLSITNERRGSCRAPNAKERKSRDAVEHRARRDERQPEI